MEKSIKCQLGQALTGGHIVGLTEVDVSALKEGAYHISTDGDLPWINVDIKGNEVTFQDGSRGPLGLISNHIVLVGKYELSVR